VANVTGTQRLNQAVAERLVAGMTRAMTIDTRLAAGLPFYVGHPDFINAADPDSARRWMQEQPPSFGWIKEFSAGPQSLLLRVEWTAEGAALVNSKKYRFFSPFFRSAKAGVEKGVQIFEPRLIQSAGLTNTPNWPMPPMVNAALTDGGDTTEGGMDLLQRLIALIGDAELKTDDDVVSAVSKMIEAAKALKKSVESRWDAEDAARAALPNASDPFALAAGYIAHIGATVETLNARAGLVDGLQAKLDAAVKAHATGLVHAAVARGAVLQAHADSRIADMCHAGDAFAAKADELAALPPLMRTESRTGDVATRSTAVADRRAQFHEFVNARMADGKLGYDAAFAAVMKEHPALLDGSAAQTK
jgi:phage I-like protein